MTVSVEAFILLQRNRESNLKVHYNLYNATLYNRRTAHGGNDYGGCPELKGPWPTGHTEPAPRRHLPARVRNKRHAVAKQRCPTHSRLSSEVELYTRARR